MKIFVLIIFILSSLLADNSDEAQRLYELKKYKEAYELLSGKTEEDTEQNKGKISDLKTYKLNYIMPFARRFGGIYRSYDPSNRYTDTEAEFQISFSYDFYENLLGFGETYSLGYTQKSFWQIYAYSKPFRETNYNPELFVTFPVYRSLGDIDLNGIRVSFEHQSNGRGNITHESLSIDSNTLSDDQKYWLSNSSRSWNYFAIEFLTQYDKLQANFKIWQRLNESGKNDDNPDLINYIGYGELNLFLPYKKHQFFFTGKYNFFKHMGSAEFSYAYPVLNNKNIFWFFQVFSGFDESLIDYNHKIDKISIGFRFLYP